MRVAIAVVPLCACAAVLGIDDGHSRSGDGGAPDGAPGQGDDGPPIVYADGSGGGDDAADAIAPPPTLPDGAPIPSGCENIAPDPATGVFVAPTGADSATCGSIASPCLTVQTGIDHAHDSNQTPNVYVADGTYVESIDLKSGAHVIGGWVPGATSWARDCSTTTTRIVAPATANVTVTASSGAATLSTITIETKSGGNVQPGESLVGILATGATTALSLVWVGVRASDAGNGLSGNAGSPGTTQTCSTSGDGGSPTTPGAKGPGGDAGWFTASGYTPTSGGTGGPGAGGENGAAGGAGKCAPCVTCVGGTLSCTPNAATPECGGAGQPGCGGGGGGGGAGGGGGGSSVALLAWDAQIDVKSSVLQAGAGGVGGAGGPGGTSGSGTNGSAGGASASCFTACQSLAGIGCTGTTNATGAGGDAGGPGGNGASGGAGGDGPGGDSFAFVEGGAGKVSLDTASRAALSNGAPGASADGGNGAPGRAGSQGP